MAASATRSQSLAHFRRILREVHLQYTHPDEFTGRGLRGINIHANKVWTEAVKDGFRKYAHETDPGLVERYNPAYWDEEKGLQVDKTAHMVGFEMPDAFDESQRDQEWVAPPKFTYKDKETDQSTAAASTSAEAAAGSDTYEELKAPEEPKKRTYQIPKAFGFAEQAENDLGRPGDRKVE
ncbi:hypothetical protein BGX31_004614 [Mortierella sp. GBA43]|nr:hypothetical protein BGX31_004614 [Mortierella sp. GBA43]